MRCPYCGDKVHDPGFDRFCPSCGKELPHESSDEKAIKRDTSLSVSLFIIALILVILGASFILPDIILRMIIPDMESWYWPYDFVILVAGIVLFVIRHPFAKRARQSNAILLEKAQAQWTCSYCGADNPPGSGKCVSCGAPLKRGV